MGLLAQEAETNGPLSGRPYKCRVADILQDPNVDDADRAAINQVMHPDSNSSNSGLSIWLRKYGHIAAQETIRKHRNGFCACGQWFK